MPAPSDPLVLALLGVRLKSFGEADAVAALVGLDLPVVEAQLAVAADEAWVLHREGRISGWMLTPTGRVEGERLLAAELDAAGARDAVVDAYRRFLLLNPRLLAVCTDWQLREVDGEQVPNDHTDEVHDAAAVAHLHGIDLEAQPVCEALAGALDRFGTYGPRLAHALGQVDAGHPDWFTRPTIASYHTVWFELHENLLATLGIDRASESAPAPHSAPPH